MARVGGDATSFVGTIDGQGRAGPSAMAEAGDGGSARLTTPLVITGRQ